MQGSGDVNHNTEKQTMKSGSAKITGPARKGKTVFFKDHLALPFPSYLERQYSPFDS